VHIARQYVTSHIGYPYLWASTMSFSIYFYLYVGWDWLSLSMGGVGHSIYIRCNIIHSVTVVSLISESF